MGSMLRKGYLVSDKPLNVKAIRSAPRKPEPKEPAPQAEPEAESGDPDSLGNGEMEIIKSIDETDSVSNIRAAMDAAGVDYPNKAKKKDLLGLRKKLLGGD